MTFWEQLKDAFNRFFGHTIGSVPIWKVIVIFAMMAFLMVIYIRYDRVKSELDDEGGAEVSDRGRNDDE